MIGLVGCGASLLRTTETKWPLMRFYPRGKGRKVRLTTSCAKGFCRSVCVCVFLSICPYESQCLSQCVCVVATCVCFPLCVSACLFMFVPTCLSFSACICGCLSQYLPLPLCTCFCLFVCMYVCMYTCIRMFVGRMHHLFELTARCLSFFKLCLVCSA